MELDEILGLAEVRRADDAITYAATIDDVYTIGDKVHGGSAQMLATNAAHTAFLDLTASSAPPLVRADGATPVPVAVTSTFLSAPDPDRVELRTRLVKRGRTVSVVDVDVVQGGRVMINSSVVFGILDDGQPQFSAPTPVRDLPVQPPPDGLVLDGSPMADIVHLHPVLDFVIDPATLPAARGERGDAVVRGWVRPKRGASHLPFVTLVCDISPPVVMNLGIFGWAPTVTLSTYLRRIPTDVPGAWLRFANASIEVGRGMFESDHTVIDSTGVVVGQSRQLALIPAKRVDGPAG